MITCPVCKLPLATPGFDNMPLSEEQVEYLDELKERAERHAQQRYRAMRER